MSETGNGDDPETGDDTTQQPAATTDPGTGDTDEPDWKAKARLWETRAKANADAAEKLQKIEDANKTELQRAQDAANQAKAEADAAKLDAARTRIAASKGIPAELADMLSGSTAEEIDAAADKLAKAIKPGAPDLKQGDRGKPKPASPDDQFRQFLNKQRTGAQ